MPDRTQKAADTPQPQAEVSKPAVRHRSRPVLVVSNSPAAPSAAEGHCADGTTLTVVEPSAGMGLEARATPDVPQSKHDYVVGYGKPPTATRFQKGRSGNPRGRPKKAESATELLRKQLGTKVLAKVDGRSRKMTLLEAGIAQQVKIFLAGDKKAFAMLMAMLGELGGPAGGRRQAAEPPPQEPASSPSLDTSSRAALADYHRTQLLGNGYSPREVDGILTTMGLVAPPPSSASLREEDDDVVI